MSNTGHEKGVCFVNTNLAYQDDFEEKRRLELIGGKVVMMSPASSDHNSIVGNINGIFWSYLRGKKCVPYGDNEKVFLSETDHFVPDFMVVCNPDKIKPDGIHGAPDLVVEVLSPSSAKYDRAHKKDSYAKAGVREYWLVSPGDKSVEVYRTNGTEFVLHDIYALHPDWQVAQMSDEERAALATHFKCSLFDDLDIFLEDVFYRTF